MKRVLILLAIAAQITFLIGMYVNSLVPLYYGQEIKVKTEPIDPRSLFRGNYVELSYEFSLVENSRHFKNGARVYAVLKKGEDGIYALDKITEQKPSSGLFLRGRVAGTYGQRIKYGIEAYFMPKDKALELESQARAGKVVTTLGVLKNGRAGIKDIDLLDEANGQ